MRQHHPTRPARPPRALRLVLAGARAVALGAVLGLLVVGGVTRAQPHGHVETRVAADRPDPVLARLMSAQDCSTRGLGPGTIPGSALVRTGAGEVRVVSFERGWAVNEGNRPGTLVAVCRRDEHWT